MHRRDARAESLESRRDRGRAALARIANALGCSVESLYASAHGEAYPDTAAELVRLWFRIEDEGARRKLLEQARELARGWQ